MVPEVAWGERCSRGGGGRAGGGYSHSQWLMTEEEEGGVGGGGRVSRTNELHEKILKCH